MPEEVLYEEGEEDDSHAMIESVVDADLGDRNGEDRCDQNGDD